MTTITTAAAAAPVARRVKPVRGHVRLFVEINGQLYAAWPLHRLPGVTARVWRLRKPEGISHDVHLGERGPECTCPDYTFRRSHRDPKGCKHVAGLRAAGLLD